MEDHKAIFFFRKTQFNTTSYQNGPYYNTWVQTNGKRLLMLCLTPQLVLMGRIKNQKNVVERKKPNKC